MLKCGQEMALWCLFFFIVRGEKNIINTFILYYFIFGLNINGANVVAKISIEFGNMDKMQSCGTKINESKRKFLFFREFNILKCCYYKAIKLNFT